ncbi:MAG: hypothetical protein V4598_03335 [Bdellovibrionota bacterium]
MKSSLTPYWESFKIAESSVSDDPSGYRGLSPNALCTDPEDILSIIHDPLIHGTWVDLGSGYGHTVLTYAETFPERHSIGIEREKSRAELSRKIIHELHLKAEIITDDLLHCVIPEGDVYFLYFPQGHVLDRILSVLRERKVTLVVIESHGDLFPRLEKEEWLVLKKRIALKSRRHDGYARIYESTGHAEKLSGLHEYSFQERFFLIQEKEICWIGESLGLFASGDDYQLIHPPRTIQEENVVKIMTINELSAEERFLTLLRRTGELQFVTGEKNYSGFIRKIITAPAFSVEFSCGERVEWRRIQLIKQGQHLCYDSSSGFFSLPHAL